MSERTDPEENGKSVYGRNEPTESVPDADGIREKTFRDSEDEDESFDRSRKKSETETGSGGMGREESPKPEAPEGEWHHEGNEDKA